MTEAETVSHINMNIVANFHKPMYLIQKYWAGNGASSVDGLGCYRSVDSLSKKRKKLEGNSFLVS